MATLNVKIVGVEGESVLVKYASENSAKGIDEYDAVAYQPKAMGYHSLEEFIEGIKPGLAADVMIRDKKESAPVELDLSSWHGHESAHDVGFTADSAARPDIPAQRAGTEVEI
jgi:hypothetical protein